MSETQNVSTEPECMCAEINTRHCPVHGQDSKPHSKPLAAMTPEEVRGAALACADNLEGGSCGYASQLLRSLVEQYEVQRDKLVTLDAEYDHLKERLGLFEEKSNQPLLNAARRLVKATDNAERNYALAYLVVALESSPAISPHCYCGDLTWTEKHYGRLTHKHACPARTETWCQTHPAGDCDPASEPEA